MSINRVNISGNLTRDPDLRMTASGMAVMNFGVAVNDRRKNNQTGQWEDVANFVDCVIFGQRANSLQNILRKGFKVSIDGKLRQSTWQDKNTGQNRSKLEVVVDDIDFMQSKNQGGYQQPAQPARPAAQPARQAQPVQQVQQAQPVQTAQPVQQVQQVQQVQAVPIDPAPAPAYQPDGSVVYDSEIPF